jgi:hypothetical protein
MTIVNDDSRVIKKLETSLTDDTIVIINDRHMFIVQAAGCVFTEPPTSSLRSILWLVRVSCAGIPSNGMISFGIRRHYQKLIVTR